MNLMSDCSPLGGSTLGGGSLTGTNGIPPPSLTAAPHAGGSYTNDLHSSTTPSRSMNTLHALDSLSSSLVPNTLHRTSTNLTSHSVMAAPQNSHLLSLGGANNKTTTNKQRGKLKKS